MLSIRIFQIAPLLGVLSIRSYWKGERIEKFQRNTAKQISIPKSKESRL
jgi:hypothetical protein